MILLFTLVINLQDNSIDQCIEQLLSGKPEVRELAAKQLHKLGTKAQPALELAAKSSDPELAQRAQDILKQITSDLAAIELARLRETLAKAKTITIQFEGEWEDADGDVKNKRIFNGAWVVGDAGKARSDFKSRIPPDTSSPVSIVLRSNGSRMIGGRHLDFDKPVATPKTLRSDLNSGLLIFGAKYSAVLILKDSLDTKEGHLACARWGVPTSPRLLESKESGQKVLFYKIYSEMDGGIQGPLVLESSLWIDAQTGLPAKRRITFFDKRTGAPESTITERYTEFFLDKEVSNEGFNF